MKEPCSSRTGRLYCSLRLCSSTISHLFLSTWKCLCAQKEMYYLVGSIKESSLTGISKRQKQLTNRSRLIHDLLMAPTGLHRALRAGYEADPHRKMRPSLSLRHEPPALSLTADYPHLSYCGRGSAATPAPSRKSPSSCASPPQPPMRWTISLWDSCARSYSMCIFSAA